MDSDTHITSPLSIRDAIPSKRSSDNEDNNTVFQNTKSFLALVQNKGRMFEKDISNFDRPTINNICNQKKNNCLLPLHQSKKSNDSTSVTADLDQQQAILQAEDDSGFLSAMSHMTTQQQKFALSSHIREQVVDLTQTMWKEEDER